MQKAQIHTTVSDLNLVLFELEGYGADVFHNQQIVAIPFNSNKLTELCKKVKAEGWFVQIGKIYKN